MWNWLLALRLSPLALWSPFDLHTSVSCSNSPNLSCHKNLTSSESERGPPEQLRQLPVALLASWKHLWVCQLRRHGRKYSLQICIWVSSSTPAVISINIISGSHSIMGFYSAHLACGTRAFVTLQWIEQIAPVFTGDTKSCAEVWLCTALITQLPIHSRNDSAATKGNCPGFFLWPSGCHWFYRVSAGCHDFGAANRTVPVYEVLQCEWLWKDWSLWGKSAASFHIHKKYSFWCAVSGKWGGVECATGGSVPHPQSWPFHHDWIN